ncbi:MAG: ArsI/CadI family heavy metal resistance metalloenzyme [Verrucomicrobiota bacterium]
METNRLQLALNVADLEKAIDFYTQMFGVELNKRKPGYANMIIQNPPVKLCLFEKPESANRVNHLGVEVFDDATIDEAASRLEAANINHTMEKEEVCCFAAQNKVITHDPDGSMWEYYRVLSDSETFYANGADKRQGDSACSAEGSSEAAVVSESDCCS